MKKKLVKLLEVKSIITLALFGTLIALLFATLLMFKEIDTDLKMIFVSALSSVLTYFFTHKKNKEDEESEV